MKITQAFKMAFSSLYTNKMRSFLTMLGMIIGVAAVIGMMSIMDGMIGYTMDTFNEMGADLLTVNLMGQADSRYVKEDEMYAFVEENAEYFKEASPYISVRMPVRNGEKEIEVQSINAVSEAYDEMTGRNIGVGRFLSYSDMENRNHVCVIGTYNAYELFDSLDVIGKTIRIGTDKYEIVGIMEEKGDSKENSSDDCVYVPYSTASRAMGSAKISTWYIQILDTEQAEKAQEVLEDFLYSVYRDTDMYGVINMVTLLDMMDEMVGIMENILIGIAAISLLVAGIGIMNIMLVSVSERTREIGIRKSLGAKKKDILIQFVIEAATISSVGGIFGIICGAILTGFLGNLVGIDCLPSRDAIILSFSVAAGIGLTFGFMPARRAANLNPIDALRSE